MERKAISGIMLILLLINIASLAFNIQLVEAEPQTRYADNEPFVFGTTQDSPYNTFTEPSYTSIVDIIHPQPGHFSNYSQTQYYSNGTAQWYGWWNTSYTSYVQPHIINTTHVVRNPSPSNGTYWCTVDKTNRLVTNTNPTFWWNQTWYILWIETNVTVGSVINWFVSNATIVGSKILNVAGQTIDAWIAKTSLYQGSYDLSYYDKQSGLMVDYEFFMSDNLTFKHTLTATNIPIGGKLSTAVYFNVSSNPVGVGENLTLKGILVNEFSQSLSNETVKLYARPLTGSWQYITSVTTDTYGIFMWHVTIPSVTGIFVFAVYYPGSQMYESTYNLATLIIQ